MSRLFTKYGIRPNEIRRARKEFFLKVGAVVGIIVVFTFLVFLARLGPGMGATSGDRANFLSDSQREELRQRIDSLEQEFQAIVVEREGSLEEENIDLLNEAIELQRRLNHTPDGIITLRDTEKFEQLSRLRDLHMGNILFAQSESAVQAAENALTEKNTQDALRFLRGARELQERINTNYPRSETRSTARMRQLDNRIIELTAGPIFELSAAAEAEGRKVSTEGKFEQAVIAFTEALRLQEILQREYRTSRFASVARLRSLERELLDSNAAIRYEPIQKVLEQAAAAVQKEDTNQAVSLYQQAAGMQIRLNEEFAGSRYASSTRIQEIEILRQNAAGSIIAANVRAKGEQLDNLLVRRNIPDARRLIQELARELEQIKELYPLSRHYDAALVEKINYLQALQNDIGAIQDNVHNNLKAIPGRDDGLQMLATEVHQLLYSKVMLGENPSNSKGDRLPVESVSWHEAQTFCRRLSWVLGLKIDLPSRDEFMAALGDLASYDLETLTWNSLNSDRTIQPIGQRRPNSHGFFDLLGNVTEWLRENVDGGTDAQASVIGGSIRDTARILSRVPVESRLRNERNRITGFRIIVQ